jgi:hypothetical protein
MYEHLSNEQIIASVATRNVFTAYAARMAAGERIAQQAARIAALETELEAERRTIVTIPCPR